MPENTLQRLNRINNAVTDSVQHFSAMVEESAKHLVPEMLVQLQRQIVIDLLSRVVLKTPVDTGRARGNWQVEVGKIPSGTTDDTSETNTVISKGLAKLSKLGFGEIVWVANNLDYVTFLEDGSSDQAPKGMLRVSLVELEAIFQ